MIEVQFPRDALEPDERTGVLDPRSSIETGTDGVKKRRPADTTRYTYLQRVKPVQVDRLIDSSTVCQVGLARLLMSVTMHRHNLDKLIAGDVQSSSFKLSRVALGWPRREEQLKPLPMAVILPVGEGVYAMPNFEVNFIERTEDAYGEGTVLRETSQLTQEFAVHILSAHHEERRAIRAAFERDLLAELDDDQTGRKQIVEEYYNRVCRINLLGMEDPDDAPRAQANEFELVARFQAIISVVQLVSTPGRIQMPLTSTTVGTALI